MSIDENVGQDLRKGEVQRSRHQLQDVMRCIDGERRQLEDVMCRVDHTIWQIRTGRPSALQPIDESDLASGSASSWTDLVTRRFRQ
jgi:hypothetical protein